MLHPSNSSQQNNGNPNNNYGQFQNSHQFTFAQQQSQQQQLSQQQMQQMQMQQQYMSSQAQNANPQQQYIKRDMPMNVNDLQDTISPQKQKNQTSTNRIGSSKKKTKQQRSDEKQQLSTIDHRHSSNQFQSQTAQQMQKLQYAYPNGISSTASPKRVQNINNPTSQVANSLALDQYSSQNLQYSNSSHAPLHLKNSSNFYQTTASKYSQDSNSKSSAHSGQNFIQNQAQLPTNKNHLTKKQIHPASAAHLYASNHNSNNNNNPNLSSQQISSGNGQNGINSQQQVQNMMQLGQIPNSASQNIAGFYNQITPKNNKRNFQDSLQNTIQGPGLQVKNGISLQNSKTKPIFNHNSNQGTVSKQQFDNISTSTQMTSQRQVTSNIGQKNLLLQNIKLKRAQHDNNSIGSQGITNIVLDSSGSAIQNFSSNGGTFQEIYSTEGHKQQPQQIGGQINGLDLKLIMPLSTKNFGAGDNQFTTSIFSKNQLTSGNTKKNFKIINNMIHEQNMKQSYEKDDKSISIRQDSSKRSQKTQDRIQNMIQQNLESPKEQLNFNNMPRNESNKQSLSPKQRSLKQQLLMNQQQWLMKSQQSVGDQPQSQLRDQKSSSRSKAIKKNFSITQNNLKIKSPYNQQLSGNQSNLLKFFHQNSKFQKAQNMNSVNAGFKNSFSNYLQTLNHTQDQQAQILQNLKQQPITQVAHLVNPQLDMYTQNGHMNQLSYDAAATMQDTNQYYYQLSNHKRKNQSTDRRHLSNTQKVTGRNAVSLTKRETANSQGSKKQASHSSNNGGLQGSSKKLNKKRAQSQVKSSLNIQSLDDEMYNQQMLEQQMRINQLENQVQQQQQEIEQANYRPETVDQGIDLQTSFEKQRTSKVNIKVKSYRNDLNLFIEKLNQNSTQEKDKLLEEFYQFLQKLTEDAYILDPDCPSMRDLISECFKVYNDQFKLMQSQKNTQQNISPSAYEILKQDYDKLLKENQFNKEKLKMAQEYSQTQRQNKDKLEKKLEEREQVILLMQETFEKELENLYTENDIKKFARELNVLYEQNQELHKMNKRMKYELRMAQEREHQFIKIIKRSPELVRMLDMEDSSILENKAAEFKPKPQEVLVSSKLVPINKLDLEKVAEIQKLQANGTLPPLEESKIIDKQEMREQMKDMIIQDNDSDDEHSLIQHEEMNRKKDNQQHLQGGNGIQQQQLYDDSQDYGDEDPPNFQDAYGSEDGEEEGLYDIENQEINNIVQIDDQNDYIYKTQNQQLMNKGGSNKNQQQFSEKNRPPERKQKNLHQSDDEDLDDL